MHIFVAGQSLSLASTCSPRRARQKKNERKKERRVYKEKERARRALYIDSLPSLVPSRTQAAILVGMSCTPKDNFILFLVLTTTSLYILDYKLSGGANIKYRYEDCASLGTVQCERSIAKQKKSKERKAALPRSMSFGCVYKPRGIIIISFGMNRDIVRDERKKRWDISLTYAGSGGCQMADDDDQSQ